MAASDIMFMLSNNGYDEDGTLFCFSESRRTVRADRRNSEITYHFRTGDPKDKGGFQHSFVQ